MRAWRWLARRGSLDVLLAVALGYALVSVADEIANVVVSVLAQQLAPEDDFAKDPLGGLPTFLRSSPGLLNFSIGDTLVVYGQVLGSLLTLSLVTIAGLAGLRWRERTLTNCSFCLSKVPIGASVCRHCLLELDATDDELRSP